LTQVQKLEPKRFKKKNHFQEEEEEEEEDEKASDSLDLSLLRYF